MKMPRDILGQQRGQRFSCSAENIHDALRNVNSFNFFLIIVMFIAIFLFINLD